ncbi:MAG: hypothetical protein AB1486_31600, partial [Planctomycetota bacterium]
VPGLPDNFPGKCGKPAACFWPPVQLNETMVAFAPGADGRLRCIYFDPETSGLRADVVSPEFRSHGRCTYIWSGPSGGPYVIVGGYDNSDPDPDDKCILTMIDPETSTILDQFDGFTGQGNFGAPMAIEKYSANQILVGHGRTVSVVNLITDPEPGFSTSPPAPPYELEIPGIPDAADYLEAGVDPPPGNYPEIGGVEIYTSGGGKCICVTAPNGRAWILSHTPIDFTRTTEELPRPPLSEAKDWYSNRSVGHAFSIDDNTQMAEQNIWVSENGLPYYRQAGQDFGRILLLDPMDGIVTDWRGGVDPAPLYGAAISSRGMMLDESTVPATPYYFMETGILAEHLGQTYRYALQSGFAPWGGHIFQISLEGYPVGSIIQNFDAPVEPPHTSFNGKAWPFVGEHYYRGQVGVTGTLQGIRGYGNNTAYAPLKKGAVEVNHIIVSTLGGLVYAVDKTEPYSVPGGLTYSSSDLGWCLLGLAVGDVDHDDLNEVVVGSLVDAGGYTDWYPVPNHKKNRGQLVILDTDNLPAPNKFRETVVDISNASDPPIANGFGAGVCGIAIDDVDNDGWNEMWVTDSRGYLYLLWYDQAAFQWKCVFRSDSLGTYAGIYSKIYPYHEVGGGGQTTHLLVFTPGYVYRFEVDGSALAGLTP